MSGNEFSEHLVEKGLSNGTVKSYAYVVERFIKWIRKTCPELVEGENLEIEQISYNDILHYIQHNKKRSVSQSTLCKEVNCIGQYFQYLVKANKISVDPTSGITIQGGKRKQLYHCLLYTSPSPRDKRQSRMPSSA